MMAPDEVETRLIGILGGADDDDPLTKRLFEMIAETLQPVVHSWARTITARAIPDTLSLPSRSQSDFGPGAQSITAENAAAVTEYYERKLVELDAAVKRGELVRRDDVIGVFEQGIVEVCAEIRSGVRQMRHGEVAPDEIDEAALESLLERALARLDFRFKEFFAGKADRRIPTSRPTELT